MNRVSSVICPIFVFLWVKCNTLSRDGILKADECDLEIVDGEVTRSCMLQFQFEIRYDDRESDPPLEMMDGTKHSQSEAGTFICSVLIN